MAEGLAYKSMFNPTQYRVDSSATEFGFGTNYNVDDALKASQFDFSGVKVPSAEAVSKIDYSKVSPVVTDTEYGGLVQAGNSGYDFSKSITPTTDGLSYNSVVKTWTPEQWQNFGSQGGTVDANNNLVFGTKGMQTGVTKEPGMFDWLGSDNMKGIGTIGGLAMSGLGIFNTMNAQKEAKRQWEAENARADEIMAMNREKYNQYKADRDRLNAGYGGK